MSKSKKNIECIAVGDVPLVENEITKTVEKLIRMTSDQHLPMLLILSVTDKKAAVALTGTGKHIVLAIQNAMNADGNVKALIEHAVISNLI